MSLKRLLTLGMIVGSATVLGACDDDGDNGTGPGSAPSAPTNVQAEVNGTSVTITFTAGSNATSHTVTITTTDEDDRTATASGSSATFSDLTENKTYSAQVTATNAEGSATSSSVVFQAGSSSNVVEVSGEILQDVTWTADKVWVLKGPVTVGRDIEKAGGVAATLTIEPGTTVIGGTPTPGTRSSLLIVTRGSQLVADANANVAGDKSVRPAPEDVIVFTSFQPRGQRARGDWGGMVINGRAPISGNGEALGEGESGFYGGSDANDNSGILRGVRVEFAGDDFTPTDQLNGIAFQGVGAGTTVEYIQVHHNTDDGIEPFGGNVSITHSVMTGVGDDSYDGTDGYKGFWQFGIVQQIADDADQGFELSNNGDTEDLAPRSTAVVANVTAVGANIEGEISTFGGESDFGMLLREGAYWRLYNNIVTNFGDAGLCIEGDQAEINANNRLGGSTDVESTLSVENNIFWNNDADNGGSAAADQSYNCADYAQTAQFAAQFSNMIADPNLPASALAVGSLSSPPNFIPTGMPAGYTAFDVSTLNGGAGLVMPVDGRTLQATSYAGAVEPGTQLSDAWYFGWTVWSRNGSDSRPNQNGQ